MVVYLKHSDNNRALMVPIFFVVAMDKFCWPSRVRTDKEVEKVEVKGLVLSRRGEVRGSI